MKINMLHNVKKIIDDHGPTIAGVGAVVCLGVSLYAAFKASEKVVEAKKDYEKDMNDLEASENQKRAEGQEIDPEEHKKAVHKIKMKRNIEYIFAYKWAGMFGIGSALLMFTSCHMSGTAIAGLAGLCKAKEKEIVDLKNKVKEKIGEEKLEEIKSEIRQEHAEKNVPRDSVNIDPKDIREVKPDGTEGDDKPPFDGVSMGHMTVESLIYDDDIGTAYQIPKWQLHDAEAMAFEFFANNREKMTLNELREIMGIKKEELLKFISKERYLADDRRGWTDEYPFKGFFIKPIRWHNMWIGSLTFTNDPICLY